METEKCCETATYELMTLICYKNPVAADMRERDGLTTDIA